MEHRGLYYKGPSLILSHTSKLTSSDSVQNEPLPLALHQITAAQNAGLTLHGQGKLGALAALFTFSDALLGVTFVNLLGL